MKDELRFRRIELGDPPIISAAFAAQGWDKPVEQYERYLREQAAATRAVIIAEVKASFAGYLTIQWEANYLPFREAEIPEIVDFNVLKKFQRRGIGNRLMDEAEAIIAKRSTWAGIGVGLISDYGAAQVLYVKRGYIPDGRGIVSGGRSLGYGDVVEVGDEPVLHLRKALSDRH